MKLPCALVATALCAALLIHPVASISSDAAAAADSVVDLTETANISDQHEQQQQQQQQRELWPYFKKE